MCGAVRSGRQEAASVSTDPERPFRSFSFWVCRSSAGSLLGIVDSVRGMPDCGDSSFHSSATEFVFSVLSDEFC